MPEEEEEVLAPWRQLLLVCLRFMREEEAKVEGKEEEEGAEEEPLENTPIGYDRASCMEEVGQ